MNEKKLKIGKFNGMKITWQLISALERAEVSRGSSYTLPLQRFAINKHTYFNY
jgi:hypothetical protein